MKYTVAIVMTALTVVLIAFSSLSASRGTQDLDTPDGAVRTMLHQVQNRDFRAAYVLVSNKNEVDQPHFTADLAGRNGDLRTLSSLSDIKTRVLRESDSEALVRADLQWSTAVGAIYDTRDLKVVHNGKGSEVVWPVTKQVQVPPQVIPVNFLRWDVVTRDKDDDFGAQNVDAPHVRIVSMNAVAREGGTTILGEIVNEDTVPGFVSVNATLVAKDGSTLGEESSFDKVSHVLLPKEVSPFRVDFPNVKLADVKNVRMEPSTLLVPASADPTIGVLHQRVEKDATGKSVLAGELVNQSGRTVNIPHVLATFYDNQGRVVWVSDAYVDHALPPQTPQPFTVALREDLASKVQNYRVTVNQYTMDR